MREIRIFENKYCQPSQAEPLVERLRSHYNGQARVSTYDLSKPEGDIPIPPALFFALEAGDETVLPALAVDSVVVTEGWLPDASEVVGLVEEGQPVGRRARQAATGCCSTGGGCC